MCNRQWSEHDTRRTSAPVTRLSYPAYQCQRGMAIALADGESCRQTSRDGTVYTTLLPKVLSSFANRRTTVILAETSKQISKGYRVTSRQRRNAWQHRNASTFIHVN